MNSPANVLVPRPGGIYADDVAELFEDVGWLCNGNVHAHKDGQCDCTGTTWCPREDALIKTISEDA